MLIEQAELAFSVLESVMEYGGVTSSLFDRIVDNSLKILDIYLNDVLQDHARDALKKTKIGY